MVQESKKCILPITNENKVLYYVSDNKLYEIFHSTHCSVGHNGRDFMIKELSTIYKNTRTDIEMFL